MAAAAAAQDAELTGYLDVAAPLGTFGGAERAAAIEVHLPLPDSSLDSLVFIWPRGDWPPGNSVDLAAIGAFDFQLADHCYESPLLPSG